MKNILIIGGAGYIGRSIINLLKKKNYNIFVIDNLSTTKKNFLKKKIKFYKIDICNKKILSNNFKKNNYDTVIHLAAKCIVSEGEKLPKKYYNINVEGTKNIINCSKKYKIKNFIF